MAAVIRPHILAALALAIAIAGCAALPLAGYAVRREGPPDVATDYLAKVCTLAPDERAEVVTAINAAIAPDSVMLNCATR